MMMMTIKEVVWAAVYQEQVISKGQNFFCEDLSILGENGIRSRLSSILADLL